MEWDVYCIPPVLGTTTHTAPRPPFCETQTHLELHPKPAFQHAEDSFRFIQPLIVQVQVEGTYYFKETLGKRKRALIILQENCASLPPQLLCENVGERKAV